MPMTKEERLQQDELSQPEASDVAMLRIPSFLSMGAPEGHGGSTFQVRDVARYKESSFPLGEKAHSPRDVIDAAQSVPINESNFLGFSWGNQVAKLRRKAVRR